MQNFRIYRWILEKGTWLVMEFQVRGRAIVQLPWQSLPPVILDSRREVGRYYVVRNNHIYKKFFYQSLHSVQTLIRTARLYTFPYCEFLFLVSLFSIFFKNVFSSVEQLTVIVKLLVFCQFCQQVSNNILSFYSKLENGKVIFTWFNLFEVFLDVVKAVIKSLTKDVTIPHCTIFSEVGILHPVLLILLLIIR